MVSIFCQARIAMAAAALFSLITTELVVAQPLDGSIPTLVLELFSGTFSNATSLGTEVVAARSVRPLDEVVVFPNWLSDNSEFGQAMDAFDRIPSGSPDSGVSTIADVISRVSAEIEFGTRELSAEQAAELKRYRNILYTDESDTKSTDYISYLDYESKYLEQVKALATEQNAAARASIQARLLQLERDWQLFGMRAEIDQALQQIAALSPPDPTAALDQWKAGVAEYRALSAGDLEGLLSRMSWLRISASSSEITASGPITASGSGVSADLPSVSRISFDATLVELPRQILSDPLLQNAYWRLRTGEILSDGNPAADDAAELMPRVISGLVIVKNLELQFSEDISGSVQDVLDGDDAVVSEIPLTRDNVGGAVLQRRSIAIPGPIVIATMVDDLAKIPSPQVGLAW